jgi:hypothetical protein
MERGMSQAPTTGEKGGPRADTCAHTAEAVTRRLADESSRRHEDEALDEALLESFPASDPPSSWAGPR